MTITRSPAIRWGLGAFAVAVLTASNAFAQPKPPPAPSAEKQKMIDLGIEHKTARGLYDYLKQQANGGKPLTWQTVPDWTGLWTRQASVFFWDPDQTSMDQMPTAKMTPKYEKMFLDKLDKVHRGVEFDALSNCEPAGMPRWMVEPFLREWVVTPKETWLITEQQNEIRRVYTDGRDHPKPEDAYPLYEGDSIGFWDGDRLVIHTSQMRAGQYQRIQPFYSDQVETVEIWRLADPSTMVVDVWSFDPPALIEPWYTKQVYKKLDNEDKSLRIRYWNCRENQNNTVTETKDGSSTYEKFTFTKKDDKAK